MNFPYFSWNLQCDLQNLKLKNRGAIHVTFYGTLFSPDYSSACEGFATDLDFEN